MEMNSRDRARLPSAAWVCLLVLSVPAAVLAQSTWPDPLFHEAEGLLARGLYHEAASVYDSFTEKYPRDSRAPEAQYKAAEALRLTGDRAGALARFQKLIAGQNEDARGLKRAARLPKSLRGSATLRVGQLLYLTGDQVKAAKTLKLLLESTSRPIAAAARYYLARSHLAAGDPARALTLLADKSLRRDQVYGPAALWARAELHDQRGEHQQAAESYQKLAKSFAKSDLAAEAMLRAGEIYRRQGQNAKALESFDRFLKRFRRGSLATAARYGRAAALQADGQADKARQAARSLVDDKSAPARIRAGALLVVGVAELAAERYGPADEALARVVRDFPDSDFAQLARVKRVWALSGQGQHKRALAAAEKILATQTLARNPATVQPLLSEVRYAAAQAALALKKFTTAVHLLEENARGDDELAALSAFRLGEALEAAGRGREAAAAFDRVTETQKGHAFEQAALAHAAARYLENDDAQRAGERARTLLERFPNSAYGASTRWNLAMALAARKDFSGMGELMDELIARHPDAPRLSAALYWSGWTSLRAKQLDQAARRLQRLLEDHPDSEHTADARVRLAFIRHRKKKFAAAAALFEAQVKEDPRLIPAGALLWLGLHHFEAKRFESSDNALEILLMRKHELSDPLHEVFLLAWGELRLARGDPRGARSSFEALFLKFPDSKLAARAAFGLGRALRQLDKLAVAEAMLVKAQDDLGQQAKNRANGLLAGLIQFELGKTLQGRNENEQAARHFMRVAIL